MGGHQYTSISHNPKNNENKTMLFEKIKSEALMHFKGMYMEDEEAALEGRPFNNVRSPKFF